MSESDGLEVLGARGRITDANDDTITLHPLTLSDYATAREESLDWYRRDHLKTYAKNVDLLPGKEAKLDEKFEAMAEKRYEDLPPMEIIEYIDDENAWRIPINERKVRSRHFVEYALWWMAGNPTGMLFVIWLAARREPSQSNWSPEELESKFISPDGTVNMQALERAAQRLGRLSNPDPAGNEEAPTDGGKERRRDRRKRKKRATGS